MTVLHPTVMINMHIYFVGILLLKPLSQCSGVRTVSSLGNGTETRDSVLNKQATSQNIVYFLCISYAANIQATNFMVYVSICTTCDS